MSARTIDPRALRAFIHVAREGNISRAAEGLHLTQPAVSLQLKCLAEFTGLHLFERTTHGVVLTRDGATLLPQAERALAGLAEFSHSAQRLVGSVKGTLRMGTVLDPDFIRLGAFLSELVGLVPEVEPDLRQGMSGDVLASILADELDVGWYIGDPADEAPRQALHMEALTRFTYRVIAPAGWGSQVLGRDWETLARLPWILTPQASAHSRLLRKVLAPLGLSQNRIAMVDQESSMLALVRSGVGLSLARDSIALNESDHSGVIIADKVSIDTVLGFVCLEKNRRSPLVDCAFNVLRKVWHRFGSSAA